MPGVLVPEFLVPSVLVLKFPITSVASTRSPGSPGSPGVVWAVTSRCAASSYLELPLFASCRQVFQECFVQGGEGGGLLRI